MSKLRFLKFCNSIFEGENKCQVSRFQSARLNGVMYLRWDAYPLKMLPVSIDMEILVSLRLRHSKSEQLGDDAQHLSSSHSGADVLTKFRADAYFRESPT
ncbi:hypothetical protein WN944_015367 [Citrus x changshan-huyou]|uniref:Uncharacterized protein n=1 Tax=Citrus x changshan-huyou TaxID=2935761 RepID=A0AAP0MBR1_9ROSI